MNKHFEEEPEDAGLIQSKPPNEEEPRETSQFIALSKQRSAARLAEEKQLAGGRQPPQDKYQ